MLGLPIRTTEDYYYDHTRKFLLWFEKADYLLLKGVAHELTINQFLVSSELDQELFSISWSDEDGEDYTVKLNQAGIEKGFWEGHHFICKSTEDEEVILSAYKTIFFTPEDAEV